MDPLKYHLLLVLLHDGSIHILIMECQSIAHSGLDTSISDHVLTWYSRQDILLMIFLLQMVRKCVQVNQLLHEKQSIIDISDIIFRVIVCVGTSEYVNMSSK